MRHELKVLNVAAALSTFAAGVFGPLFALFVQDVGGGAFAAGSAFSVFSIGAGVLVYVLGRVEDRIDRQELLVVAGYALGTVGYLGYLAVGSLLHLLLVQAVLGAGVAVRTPAFDSIYSHHLQSGSYASEWGVFESLMWVVRGISALVGGIIVDVWSFQVLFGVMAAIELGATLVAARLVLVPLEDR